MSSNTELVKSFNFLNFKKIISMKELNPNTEYVISGAYKTKTKYGEKVVRNLPGTHLFFVTRSTHMVTIGPEGF